MTQILFALCVAAGPRSLMNLSMFEKGSTPSKGFALCGEAG